MYCGNCGCPLADDSVFCTRCGTRLRQPSVPEVNAFNEVKPVQDTSETPSISETAENLTDNVQPTISEPTASEPENNYQQTSAYSPETSETPQPVVTENKVPEKVYFGKGALAFCLVVIAVLAIACGIFAGLYFTAPKQGTNGAMINSHVSEEFEHYDNGNFKW